MNKNTIDPLALPSLGLWQRCNLPRCSAVYFVLLENDVLYVGQAKDIYSRWKNHHLLKLLSQMDEPTRIAWIECSTDQLTKLETELINHYAPRLNGKNRLSSTAAISVKLPELLSNRAKARCAAEKTTVEQVCSKFLYLWASEAGLMNVLRQGTNFWKVSCFSGIEDTRLVQLYIGEAEPTLEEITKIQEVLTLSNTQIENLCLQ